MTIFKVNNHDSETASQDGAVRRQELANQHWDFDKSMALAHLEGIDFNDQHWAVILFLRRYYFNFGLPKSARAITRAITRALNKNFATQGGSKYLYRLFSGGPVSQGSRLANIRTPADTTDLSFGSRY